MIFTDGAHLVSDSGSDELHGFVFGLGLKRGWFQDGRRPHYDLTTTGAARRAEAAGACRVSSREIIEALRRARAR